ncbi:CdaR family transcriptional regulator [Nocardioides sp.]|uniref:PucR family transcriptional regulator n=1 Tax=Nocardioides sp. TaxID=35761 RepID=UPI00262F7B9A|nr:PucR family transcriptional regulator [Nocardioides sp.]
MSETRHTPPVGEFGLTPDIVTQIGGLLPRVGEDVVNAVIAEVPAYQDAWSDGKMAGIIQSAVQVALSGFLSAAAGGVEDLALATPAAIQGAFDLGGGEARSGRAPEAILAAYRIGARTAWRELSSGALAAGLSAEALVEFAALVFAWIDEVSDASVAGHAAEMASSGRERQRLLSRLGQHLIDGATAEVVDDAAHDADWPTPTTLTAVLLPSAQLGTVLSSLPPATLELDEQPDLGGVAVLLVPDMERHRRPALLAATSGRGAVVGPAKPWREARVSFQRAFRAQREGLLDDTDTHLVSLVLNADPEAYADLRTWVLAPMADLRESTREKLLETLQAWLLHQGRRDEMAAALFVHPQTVRYRISQLREIYGTRLDDPRWVLALTLALGTGRDVAR